MGISGAFWKDILRIAIGWNKSDRPIAMGTAMELLRPPVENDQTSQSFQLPWQIYVFFTKPNEATTSCIHVLVSWLILKQFSIFLLSYRSTSLET